MLYVFASQIINEPDLFQNEMSADKNLVFFCVCRQGAHSALYVQSSSNLHHVPSYAHPCEGLIHRDAHFSRICMNF